MKIQHILFLILLAVLIWRKNPFWSAAVGIGLLIVSIPLFAKHIFYTAEALTWYAAGLFLLTIILQTYKIIKTKSEV